MVRGCMRSHQQRACCARSHMFCKNLYAENLEKRKKKQMNNYGNVLSLTPAVAPSWQSRGSGSATVRRLFVSRIIQETYGRICMEIGPQVEMDPVEHR